MKSLRELNDFTERVQSTPSSRLRPYPDAFELDYPDEYIDHEASERYQGTSFQSDCPSLTPRQGHVQLTGNPFVSPATPDFIKPHEWLHTNPFLADEIENTLSSSFCLDVPPVDQRNAPMHMALTEPEYRFDFGHDHRGVSQQPQQSTEQLIRQLSIPASSASRQFPVLIFINVMHVFSFRPASAFLSSASAFHSYCQLFPFLLTVYKFIWLFS